MLGTHPAQIPRPVFHIVGRKKRKAIGCCMGARCSPRHIHEINTFFESRSDAVMYCEYSSFSSQIIVTASRYRQTFHLESRGLIGRYTHASGLVYSHCSYSNILKTYLTEMFSCLINSLLIGFITSGTGKCVESNSLLGWDDSIYLVLCLTPLLLAASFPYTRWWVTGLQACDAIVKNIYLPDMVYEIRNVYENSCWPWENEVSRLLWATDGLQINAQSFFPAKLISTKDKPPCLNWTWGIPEIRSVTSLESTTKVHKAGRLGRSRGKLFCLTG